MHPGPPAAPTDHAMTEAHRRTLLLLMVAAILVRAAFLVLEPSTRLQGDERTWTNRSVEIASKGFSPLRNHIIFYPPLYKYFLAVSWALTGGFQAARWGQVLLGSLLVPAVGLVGARVFGARTGLVAAGIVAFYPELIWFAAHLWSEVVFMLLLWWGMERLLVADERGTPRTAVAAGVLWALAVLTRETVLYFLPLAAAYLAWRAPRPGGRTRALAFLVTALLTIAPWTYRNWLIFHAFVPVSTAGGQNLFQGNSHLSRDETYALVDAVSGRVQQYRYAMGMGLQAIRDRQPWWIFEKLRDEMPHFWEADSLALIHIKRGGYGAYVGSGEDRRWRPAEVRPALASTMAVVVLVPYLAVMALFVAGAARLSPTRPVLLLLLFLVYYNALHIVTHGFARYRLPVMPIVFLVAAYAWCERGGPLRGQRRLLALALAALVALVLVPSIRINLHHPAFGLQDGETPPTEEPPSP
jgi:4-amino-4-deoxy-L-arabinose transferase-like glycosyltransferase